MTGMIGGTESKVNDVRAGTLLLQLRVLFWLASRKGCRNRRLSRARAYTTASMPSLLSSLPEPARRGTHKEGESWSSPIAEMAAPKNPPAPTRTKRPIIPTLSFVATTLNHCGLFHERRERARILRRFATTQPKAEPNRKPSLVEQCGPSVQFHHNRHIEF
jgi:hypothetical protein